MDRRIASREMGGARVLQRFAFFLYFFLNSDSSIAEKPPLEAIRQIRKLDSEEIPVIFPPSISDTQLDTIPIVNPTPPYTATPIIMPPGPPPPTTTEPTTPITTPTIPTPATTAPATSGGAWCVASPTASQTALQVALDYACGYWWCRLLSDSEWGKVVIIQTRSVIMLRMRSMITIRRTQLRLAAVSEEQHSSPTLIQVLETVIIHRLRH
ncbi:hypothetical protein HYC85_018853 [Camellia sinensis]|uniref:Uncharacterized protein n=1 Tax=Camellia sinensis TaxID=4442 RepID=A0A7J7GZ76_CAMSI|nr:hypothetical protein HYC85_018853 [Camellia sinensis]